MYLYYILEASLGPKELIDSDSYAPFTDDMVDLKLFSKDSIFDFKYSVGCFLCFFSQST